MKICSSPAEKCNHRRTISCHSHCVHRRPWRRYIGRQCNLWLLGFKRFKYPPSWSSVNVLISLLTVSAAAIHLTRNLAVELGPRHILCNSIAPGFFPSKMASGLMELQGGEEAMAAQNPNGRLGRPEDIAGAVVYLSSRASSHVNGACITLDGGTLWGRGRL